MNDTPADTAAPEVDAIDAATERVAVEKHPRAIRWMHWFNFPVLSVMIWSGLRIYWSFDWTRVPGEFGENNLIPNGFYEQLQLDRKLARGLSFHLTFGWLLAINGLFYVLYLVFSREWKHIVPRVDDLRKIPATMLHEIGLRKTKPEQGLYNVMQQLAYSTVTLMAAVIVATGFAIYKPTQLSWLTWLFGGYETARAIHFLMTAGIFAFFLIHVVQVIRAGFGNFWSMITGFELTDEAEVETELETGADTNADPAKTTEETAHV